MTVEVGRKVTMDDLRYIHSYMMTSGFRYNEFSVICDGNVLFGTLIAVIFSQKVSKDDIRITDSVKEYLKSQSCRMLW